MPAGKGTYGSKLGRPAKKKKAMAPKKDRMAKLRAMRKK